MDTELDDLHNLSGSIFSNITSVAPLVRNIVTNAKSYQKSCQGTIFFATQFIESLDALAKMALNSKGATKAIGDTLHDIMKVFCDIENMKQDLMKLFITEVIIPLESKAEQEISTSKLAHKQYIQENKVQTEIVNKATHEIVKIRKKSQRRKSKPGKYEMKEEELLEGLQTSEKKLTILRQQGLRRALTGERRIHCFIADRLCSYSRGVAVYNGRISTVLSEKSLVWDAVIYKPNELPKESEDIISHPSSYYTATMRKRDLKQNPAATYNTMDARVSSSNTRRSILEKDYDSKDGPPAPPPPPPIPNDVADRDAQTGTDDQHGSKIEEKPAVSPSRKKFADEIRFSLISESLTQEPKQRPSKIKLRALYDHTAKDSSQLTFTKGDIINPISDETSGWQYGENSRDAKTGWFPAAYAESFRELTTDRAVTKVAPLVKEKPSSKEGPTRRSSNPVQSNGPYIPAPDYDDDESEKTNAVNITGNQKVTNSLHMSMSAPTFKINGYHDAPHPINANSPSPLMPLANAMKNAANLEEGNDVPASVMPFPPPPPDFAEEEEDEIDNNKRLQAIIAENPFASVKLKRTVTNDRSKPRIAT